MGLDKDTILSLTTDIVCAYASNNVIAPDDLTQMIGTVYAQLDRLANTDPDATENRPVPAVPIEQSMTDDYLICLEDGKPFKSLKRHLRTKFDLTPEAYREKWGLPHDYPMVAPSYAKERSKLAKQMGLGRAES